MRRQFYGTGMMNFISREFANLIWGKLDERDSITVVCSKFDHISMAIFKDVDHRPHVARGQAVFGQVNV